MATSDQVISALIKESFAYCFCHNMQWKCRAQAQKEAVVIVMKKKMNYL